MKLTNEYILTRHASWLEGVDDLDPAGRDQLISDANEKLRALYVLQANDGKMPAPKALTLYMVRPDVAAQILAEFDTGSSNETGSTSRKQKYSAIESWCRDNVGAVTTPREISEVGTISYPTALRYISDHPDVFWKAGHGKYEVRDPAADRAREKNA